MYARPAIEGTEAHAHPSHAIRAYTAATNEDIFSTQYAVRSTQKYRKQRVFGGPGRAAVLNFLQQSGKSWRVVDS